MLLERERRRLSQEGGFSYLVVVVGRIEFGGSASVQYSTVQYSTNTECTVMCVCSTQYTVIVQFSS